MAKRKANEASGSEAAPSRRSTRQKTSIQDGSKGPESVKPAVLEKAAKLKAKNAAPKKEEQETSVTKKASFSEDKKPNSEKTNSTASTRQYWLMKAEPESRLEKGHDVKFSVDDLAAKIAPEPWDGIRNYVARNNLRAMKKGDLAFFYHSSCKIPAIVGIMEIVQEHSPDMTAQDPKAAYYDAKDSDPSNPKWSVVHVEFREKLKEPITLTELKEHTGKGAGLENMQMLKQSRLSVSKVSEEEWNFILNTLQKKD